MKTTSLFHIVFAPNALLTRALLLPAFAMLFCSGCHRQDSAKTQPVTNVLAQVEDTVITVEQFEAELSRRARSAPQRFDSVAAREALLDEMVRFEVLFARAKSAGYAQRPDIQQRFRQLLVTKYEEDQKPDAEKPFTPSDEDIEAFYQKHLSEWSQPEKVRPAILFWRVSPKAIAEKQQEAFERAEQVRLEALKRNEETFGDLARQHSEDLSTRYRGGDCGWITRNQSLTEWPRDVADAAFALRQPGEISPVIRAANGLYLVKLMERSAAGAQSLADIRERIIWKLQAEHSQNRQQEFLEQQKSGLRITINRAALDQIKTPTVKLARDASPPANLPRR